jgi:hypothetical protein
MEESKGKKGSN